MSAAKRQIARIVKMHRRWIKDVGEEVREYALGAITSGLAEGYLQNLRNISSNLSGLASYWGTHGVVEVLDGDLNGWQKVHHACLLHLWMLKIKFALFRKLADSPDLTFFVGQTACSYCYAVACGLDAWRAAQANLLSEMALDAGMVNRDFWRERRFEPFVLRLEQIRAGSIAPFNSIESFGVYSDILANWNAGDSFATALRQACEYHCQNMEDFGNEWIPEFDHAPYDLVPWEILAIQRLREEHGLFTPNIDHPLMQPSITQIVPSGHVEDEILHEVESFFNDYFSESS